MAAAGTIPEDEFSSIYNDYYQKIMRYVANIVGPGEAEDITQDVFDKVSRGLSEFRGEAKISTWIYRIATNTAIDRLRSAAYRHSSRQMPVEDAGDLEDRGALSAQKPSRTDQDLIRKEMSTCVQEYIDNLPPDYRTVIVLREQEGLAHKEIAEILGISPDNVKVRLHRARAKLKAALNAGCDFYHNEHDTLACDRKASQILPKPPE